MKKTAEAATATRQALLQAALHVFSTRGYAATTLEQVARAAGVTRGAIYWHFSNKAALYQALLQTFGGRSGPIMQQAAAEGGSFLEICRRILINLLMSLENDPEMRAVMELSLFKTEQSADLAEVFQEQRTATHALVTMLADIMQQGITLGALRGDTDPLDMARAFLAYQDGLFHLWLVDPSSFSLRDRAPMLAEIFIRGIQV